MKRSYLQDFNTGLFVWFFIQRSRSTSAPVPANNLCSNWHTELNLSWPPDLLHWMRLPHSVTCEARHDHTNASSAPRSRAEVFRGGSEPMFNCKGALSQILHHHHVFILAGGGRVDYEAKWGEKQTHTHTRGLVATSFMRRSCAAKPSVIRIYLHEIYIFKLVYD